MTREIKFRYYFKIRNRDGFEINKIILDIKKIEKRIFSGREDDCIARVQFTGLKDKNGIEIYEGDYLVDEYPVDDEDLSKEYHESLLPVVWCSKTLQWCVDASFAKDGSYLTSLVDYFGEFLEVKGSIYENPELC